VFAISGVISVGFAVYCRSMAIPGITNWPCWVDQAARSRSSIAWPLHAGVLQGVQADGRRDPRGGSRCRPPSRDKAADDVAMVVADTSAFRWRSEANRDPHPLRWTKDPQRVIAAMK
jgi:hypothetical protein